jgi:myo-inositol-1(or 4)-monophosphatase
MNSAQSSLINPLEVMSVVERCSATSLTWFRAPAQRITDKGHRGFDPVTQADHHVEELLGSRLAELYGDLPVIGEEHGVSGNPAAGLAWIIDPIDGTRAFISGQPQWGTLLGLLSDGLPIGGWLHLPVLAESHWAFDGEAAGVTPYGPARGRVSECTLLNRATLVSTHPSMFEGPAAERFWALERSVKLSRFGGDCHNYALLANGDVDLVVEDQMQIYDILPLVPIIESAGGVVTDRTGAAPLDGGMIIAAATRELHAAALAAMTE